MDKPENINVEEIVRDLNEVIDDLSSRFAALTKENAVLKMLVNKAQRGATAESGDVPTIDS